jgi:hypothetical protein
MSAGRDDTVKYVKELLLGLVPGAEVELHDLAIGGF